MNRESLPLINLLVTVWFPPGVQGGLRETGFRESLKAWARYLVYSGDFQLVVVNDGEPLGPYGVWPAPQRSLGHQRNGVGASWNQALATVFKESPLLLNIDDDQLLTEPYDLTPWAQMLMDDETIGAVHLSHPYPGCTGTLEPRKHGWVVRLNRHNLASGLRSCLYHKRFFDAYGGFDEGLSAHETERLFNERFCQSIGPESVLALPVPWQEGIGAKVELGQRSPRG